MCEWISVENFLKIRDHEQVIINLARERIDEAHKSADRCPPPINRRAAIAKDIVEDAVIWHERESSIWEGKEMGGDFWTIVGTPDHYGDPFKAYTADDGCRYGLDGAYIALPEPPKEATDA